MEQQQISFDDFINSGLNNFQRQAVECDTPAALVIAGAGSGKTRVITARIAYLILKKHADPTSIVALTFTNKAAGEMKERIAKFLSGSKRLPFVGTFHSYCLLLLRRNPSLVPFANFSIMDSDDQVDLIKKIINKNGLQKKISANQATYQLSTYKNNLLVRNMEEFVNPLIREIYQEYEAEKSAAHCLDFDDLLFQVLQLFRKNEEFRKTFQQKVRHVLVDEYQDTSHVQHELLKLMSLDSEKKFNLDSVCAVGDEDQSIYSWRGATVTNMLSFQSDFAPVKVVKIEQNYRSVQPILELANGLIKNNRLRNPKNLWSDRPAKNRVVSAYCRSSEQEADTIARFIQACSKSKNLDEIAVLYRTHFQSRQIEEALMYYSIPYKIIGGLQFYERKEIKDLLAYMRLVANPFDKLSLMRAINCPSRGLGPKFEQELLDEWGKNPFLDFKQILELLKNDESNAKKLAIEEFLNVFKGLESQQFPAYCLENIVNLTDYYGYLRRNFDDREAETKVENVKEFINATLLYESKYAVAEAFDNLESVFEERRTPTLENFLYEIALLQEKLEKTKDVARVQLMTLHAAKGLEFNTVIISGMNESVLPSSKSLNTNDELEEERRLFYVGITRAQEYLLLLNAYARNSFGQIVEQVPSRFLSELPSNLCYKVDVEKMHAVEVTRLWQEWIGGGLDLQPRVLTFGRSNRSLSNIHEPVEMVRQAHHERVHYTAHPEPIVENTHFSPEKALGGWKTGTAVRHDKFGQGVIIKVEKANDQDFYLTVAFKIGQKKLLSSFIKRV